jgi:Molecular chaperone (small heat shock protein)
MFGSQLYDGGLLQEFRRLEQDLDEQFGHWLWPLGIRSTARGTWPPMNVGLTPDNVEIYLFAAGLDPKSIDISVEQSLLTVSGERKVPERGEVAWYRNERFDGNFRRAISLPEDVDPDSIQARYRDGVLQITAKRPEAAKPRQIQVN